MSPYYGSRRRTSASAPSIFWVRASTLGCSTIWKFRFQAARLHLLQKLLIGDVFTQYDKFVPTETVHLPLRKAFPQNIGGADNGLVALDMPVILVDGFQAVEIGSRHAQTGQGGAGEVPQIAQIAVAIEQAGQQIVENCKLLLLPHLSFGHLVRDEEGQQTKQRRFVGVLGGIDYAEVPHAIRFPIEGNQEVGADSMLPPKGVFVGMGGPQGFRIVQKDRFPFLEGLRPAGDDAGGEKGQQAGIPVRAAPFVESADGGVRLRQPQNIGPFRAVEFTDMPQHGLDGAV